MIFFRSPGPLGLVHSILVNSSSVGVLLAALKAGASPPIPLALSCHWDGGGVGTIERVQRMRRLRAVMVQIHLIPTCGVWGACGGPKGI